MDFPDTFILQESYLMEQAFKWLCVLHVLWLNLEWSISQMAVASPEMAEQTTRRTSVNLWIVGVALPSSSEGNEMAEKSG